MNGLAKIDCSVNKFSYLVRGCATSLQYNEFGNPIDVLKKYYCKLNAPKKNEVIIKILAAPINPADINTIQGIHSKNFKFVCFY